MRYLYWYQMTMVATNIAGSGVQEAGGTRQAHFRMPAEEHEELTKYLFETGRRTLQEFALSAVREKRKAECRSRARKAARFNAL